MPLIMCAILLPSSPISISAVTILPVGLAIFIPIIVVLVAAGTVYTEDSFCTYLFSHNVFKISCHISFPKLLMQV